MQGIKRNKLQYIFYVFILVAVNGVVIGPSRALPGWTAGMVGAAGRDRAADMEIEESPPAAFELSQPEIAHPPPAALEQAQPLIDDAPPADFKASTPEIEQTLPADFELSEPEIKKPAE